MHKWSLPAVVDGHLTQARRARSRRSVQTLHGARGRRVRQVVIALVHGERLTEVDTAGAASVQVLRGRVRLAADDATTDYSAGDLLIVPDVRYTVHALEDAALLLTTAEPLRRADAAGS